MEIVSNGAAPKPTSDVLTKKLNLGNVFSRIIHAQADSHALSSRKAIPKMQECGLLANSRMILVAGSLEKTEKIKPRPTLPSLQRDADETSAALSE